jgi:hypothetical protein
MSRAKRGSARRAEVRADIVSPCMLEDLKRHIAHCRTVRRLLRESPSRHLEHLFWYDLRLRRAVSAAGIARVSAWNLWSREADEIAGNYGLSNLYYAPPPGDGLEKSAPTVWRCTSLPSRPWHDEPSAVRDVLEQNAEAIIAEYRGVARELETHPDHATLTARGRWTGMFLYGTRGARNEALCRACPTTTKVLDSLPLCRSFGFAMFSGMDPRTHVSAHCGSSNLRLRYHLGIDVPEPDRSWLRVGTETRGWRRGKGFAFDDSFQHEVEHAGDLPRVVLVVDVWHPALSAEDIRVLSHPVFQHFGRISRGTPERVLDAD